MLDAPPTRSPVANLAEHESRALRECRAALPSWRLVPDSAFRFAAPKGFSSFTMGIEHNHSATPGAVLYRRLEGKENALLDFEDEREVYLALADAGIAAACHAYEETHRVEAFYCGRSLRADDLEDLDLLGRIGRRIAAMHNLSLPVPDETFFERLWTRWRPLAQRTLVDHRAGFTPEEQEMCRRLMRILEPATVSMALDFVPAEPQHFCHNDIYHGNIFLLETGGVRLLDFEFACRNHPAFDFSNLFAETQMRHGLESYPHFAIAEPSITEDKVGALVDGYLGARHDPGLSARSLIDATFSMLPLSDFMYAMAALPLAVEPIQKIRFIPYALARFERFTAAWERRFGD